MNRRVENILSTLSLVFCAMAILLWVRSYFIYDNTEFRSEKVTPTAASTRRLDFRSNFATFFLVYSSNSVDSSDDYYGLFNNKTQLEHEELEPDDRSIWNQLTGFTAEYETTSHGSFVKLGVPAWLIASGFAVFPVLRLRKLYQLHKRREKFCVRCGYDLRATEVRCPECGTPFLKSSITSTP